MPFGVLLIGPPGSGKSTCCHGLSLFLRACRREVCLVNLDPAVESLPFACDVDIRNLVSLAAVQRELTLGPNGGLAYCFDYLEKNKDWLKVCNSKFAVSCPSSSSNVFILFCFVHRSSLHHICKQINIF